MPSAIDVFHQNLISKQLLMTCSNYDVLNLLKFYNFRLVFPILATNEFITILRYAKRVQRMTPKSKFLSIKLLSQFLKVACSVGDYGPLSKVESFVL